MAWTRHSMNQGSRTRAACPPEAKLCWTESSGFAYSSKNYTKCRWPSIGPNPKIISSQVSFYPPHSSIETEDLQWPVLEKNSCKLQPMGSRLHCHILRQPCSCITSGQRNGVGAWSVRLVVAEVGCADWETLVNWLYQSSKCMSFLPATWLPQKHLPRPERSSSSPTLSTTWRWSSNSRTAVSMSRRVSKEKPRSSTSPGNSTSRRPQSPARKQFCSSFAIQPWHSNLQSVCSVSLWSLSYRVEQL